MALDYTWPARWQNAVPPLNSVSRGNTPGPWSLERLFPYAWPVLLGLSTLIFIWGILQEHPVGWAAAALANPSGMFYNLLTLMETAPSWLLIPLSWIAVGLSLKLRVFAPWILVPLGVILYHRSDALSEVIRTACANRI